MNKATSSCVRTISALCALCFASLPVSAGLVVGLPPDTGNGNVYPFGGAYSGDYQQVYTSSLFSGPMVITNLAFYNTQINPGPGTDMNSGTWTISLSTTAADWDTLSTTPSANIGSNNTEVFSGNLYQPWTFPDTLVIDLTTPFDYIPADGNLLMDVEVTGASLHGTNILFDTNGLNSGLLNGDTIMGRLYNLGATDFVDHGYGLVTGFNTVPEPASFALLGAGLVALGLLRRR